jgi:hypothetical protein
MTQTNLTALIDAYATIKNEIASLEADKKRLEASLAELPAGAYEGERYRLTISDAVRESPDKILAAEIKEAVENYKGTCSRQYLTAHTTETSVRTHRVGVKTGKGLAA